MLAGLMVAAGVPPERLAIPTDECSQLHQRAIGNHATR
jgi:hypothetical protein